MNHNLITVIKINPEDDSEQIVENATADQIMDMLDAGFMVVKMV